MDKDDQHKQGTYFFRWNMKKNRQLSDAFFLSGDSKNVRITQRKPRLKNIAE